jgi:hypothetical protein
MGTIELAVAMYFALGLLALSAFCVRIYLTKQLPANADLTAELIFYLGQGLVWTAAGLIAGGIFAVAARAVFTALGAA